ncbi:MAG: hypothetical protein IPK19_05185 [Chloroflexi bacterium]|nr:hypothetical protein [Chloroflexota bacterium]
MCKVGDIVLLGQFSSDIDPLDLLTAIAQRAAGGTLLIVQVRSLQSPEAQILVNRNMWLDRGVRQVRLAHIRLPFDIGSNALLSDIDAAHCILFLTENAVSFVEWFQHTRVFQHVVTAHQGGTAIAAWGDSATALSAAVARRSSASLDQTVLDSPFSPGLKLIPAIVMEIALPSEQELHELLAAVLNDPTLLGIGIGGSTGVIIRQNRYLHVIGHEEVVILDASSLCDTAHGIDRLMQFAEVDVRLLIEGDTYDLAMRSTIEPVNCG